MVAKYILFTVNPLRLQCVFIYYNLKLPMNRCRISALVMMKPTQVHSDSGGQSLANGCLRNDDLKIEPATRGTRDDYQRMTHARQHALEPRPNTPTRLQWFNGHSSPMVLCSSTGLIWLCPCFMILIYFCCISVYPSFLIFWNPLNVYFSSLSSLLSHVQANILVFLPMRIFWFLFLIPSSTVMFLLSLKQNSSFWDSP